jgi:hypothetical protein
MSGASRSAAPNAGPDAVGRRGARLIGALVRLLPVFAVVVPVLTVSATLAVAGDTLGYDFRAYHAAASRVLAGQPLYDVTAAVAGPAGLFLYPPPFVLLVLPLGLLPVGLATAVWTVLILAAFALGTALLPVDRTVRWLILLLAGLSWPFVYATKLGQVGAILYLLFALGWRLADRPVVLGVSGAVGAIVKVQPGVVLVWALLTRRWAALAAGVLVLVGSALLATVLLGVGVWADFLTLLGRVNDPITTPHNFTPGAVAYQAGLSRDAAALIQYASTAAAAVVLVLAALRLSAPASFLSAVVVSQLVSPIAWDHYAMLLLLPVAWLLQRRCWWAVAIPLVTSLPLVGLVPSIVYPAAFWVSLAALLAIGHPKSESPAV